MAVLARRDPSIAHPPGAGTLVKIGDLGVARLLDTKSMVKHASVVRACLRLCPASDLLICAPGRDDGGHAILLQSRALSRPGVAALVQSFVGVGFGSEVASE